PRFPARCGGGERPTTRVNAVKTGAVARPRARAKRLACYCACDRRQAARPRRVLPSPGLRDGMRAAQRSNLAAVAAASKAVAVVGQDAYAASAHGAKAHRWFGFWSVAITTTRHRSW